MQKLPAAGLTFDLVDSVWSGSCVEGIGESFVQKPLRGRSPGDGRRNGLTENWNDKAHPAKCTARDVFECASQFGGVAFLYRGREPCLSKAFRFMTLDGNVTELHC